MADQQPSYLEALEIDQVYFLKLAIASKAHLPLGDLLYVCKIFFANQEPSRVTDLFADDATLVYGWDLQHLIFLGYRGGIYLHRIEEFASYPSTSTGPYTV